jgi:Flp pilus assembly protein TadG
VTERLSVAARPSGADGAGLSARLASGARLIGGARPARGARQRLRARLGGSGGCAGRAGRRTGRVARLRADSDRGASAVEYAILIPVFLVLAFLIIQSGIYYYARNVAQSAAEDAARSARATQASATDVADPFNQVFPTDAQLQQRAQAGFVSTLTALDPKGSFFQGGTVEAHGNAVTGLVNIDVRGSSVNLLPHFFPIIDIHATAGGSVEIFKQPGVN